MNEKILVTYASRTGATAGVAEAIGKTLAEGGLPVDVLPMRAVNDLSPYRAVVAGSAVRGGHWLPEAVQFVKAHQTELVRRPFAAFLVCITLSMKGSEQYRPGVSAWLEPVRLLVHPVSEGLFAGTLDLRKLPRTFQGLLMRMPVLLRVWGAGDHRDWNAIRLWAKSLRPLLQ